MTEYGKPGASSREGEHAHATGSEPDRPLLLEGNFPRVERFLGALIGKGKESSTALDGLPVSVLGVQISVTPQSIFISNSAFKKLAKGLLRFCRRSGKGILNTEEASAELKLALEPHKAYMPERNGLMTGWAIPRASSLQVHERYKRRTVESMPSKEYLHPEDPRIEREEGISTAPDRAVAGEIRTRSGFIGVSDEALSSLISLTEKSLRVHDMVMSEIKTACPDQAEALICAARLIRTASEVDEDTVSAPLPDEVKPERANSYFERDGLVFIVSILRREIVDIVFRTRPEVEEHIVDVPEGSPQERWKEVSPRFLSLIDEVRKGTYGDEARDLFRSTPEGLYYARGSFGKIAELYRAHLMRVDSEAVPGEKKIREHLHQLFGGREVYVDSKETMDGGCVIPFEGGGEDFKSLEGTVRDVPRFFHRRDIIFTSVEGLSSVSEIERQAKYRDCVARFEVDGDSYFIRAHALDRFLTRGMRMGRRSGLVAMYQDFAGSPDIRQKREALDATRYRHVGSWIFVVKPTRHGNMVMTCYERPGMKH